VNSRNKQIILIALSVLLVVLFLFMPEQPLETTNNIKARVEKAIRAVQSEDPMSGIQDLLTIVEEDSTQLDAQYYLGLFSIKSGQFEKAVNRFEKVITFVGLKKYPDARYQLSVCLEALGKTEASLEQLEVYMTEIDPNETEKKEAVQKEIIRLRN
jgi:TolA-binding protein|tara:strand:- start:1020 stop:1487 length:468 start_codon:yes stop_codon:yes gene_type:complete